MAAFPKFILTKVETAIMYSQDSLIPRLLNDDGESLKHPSAVPASSAVPARSMPAAAHSSTAFIQPSHVRDIINGPNISAIGDHRMEHQHHGEAYDGDTVWYCSNCGDGPIGSWNTVCTSCGHQICGGCTVEQV
jgi:hypothetical protein